MVYTLDSNFFYKLCAQWLCLMPMYKYVVAPMCYSFCLFHTIYTVLLCCISNAIKDDCTVFPFIQRNYILICLPIYDFYSLPSLLLWWSHAAASFKTLFLLPATTTTLSTGVFALMSSRLVFNWCLFLVPPTRGIILICGKPTKWNLLPHSISMFHQNDNKQATSRTRAQWMTLVTCVLLFLIYLF